MDPARLQEVLHRLDAADAFVEEAGRLAAALPPPDDPVHGAIHLGLLRSRMGQVRGSLRLAMEDAKALANEAAPNSVSAPQPAQSNRRRPPTIVPRGGTLAGFLSRRQNGRPPSG